MVTQTPLLFWPPEFGPLSKSEKKMRGGAVCAYTNAAASSKDKSETIFTNLSIGTPNLIIGRQVRIAAQLLGHWYSHGNLDGSRTLRAVGIHGGDHIKILLARNRCRIGKEQTGRRKRRRNLGIWASAHRSCAARIEHNRNIDALCRIQINRSGHTSAESRAGNRVLCDGQSNGSCVGNLYRLSRRGVQCLRAKAKAAWRGGEAGRRRYRRGARRGYSCAGIGVCAASSTSDRAHQAGE